MKRQAIEEAAVVYSDLSVDYFKMFLLNVPAAVIALTLKCFPQLYGLILNMVVKIGINVEIK
ncbi:hypothetical protein ZIOFF_001421 [Zingiber officinale]|uniref:Uncharacterized protein n=1 Tax=Zingiber officinale TaxID=94328 RepID=A0A8J5HYL2_ZINOF|nr:hypothetical protein ZIOFF_001421 [Zingiber officinale]